ncbi:DUF429 domain-containing protein [Nocardioides acrostichi]|uniref:DUF429 domain-containing protein n=1 Tax=Nocardioides acrostichi TaxID=2784339 RepID=A0A930Y965_9ACTN|nr:DUF429 domain-containing protein [Nocardioides acrostichi]MBF4163791.1 DUF429 domain-containing protein [Nocardioides acrostichi]
MHYVGIDLAWGTKQPTGLAVLDAEARLLHVSTVRTDAEIEAGLGPFVEGECLVGIDAPIVVENPTGSRPAEQQLSRDFRRFEAGTHPSNTGKPEFAEGTRARRVCRLLGLDPDPRSGRARRAIEVYPHAASVVLFDLPRTLKYKNKPGRDLDLLRAELLRLLGYVETVVDVDDHADWAALRRQVEQATRKSQLRVVEDQVDAVVCAYVALFADTRPDETAHYGDAATGCIVTPALVEGTGERRRARSTDPSQRIVQDAVRRYVEAQPQVVEAGVGYVDLVTEILDEAGINYLSVTGRTKSVTSFAEKAARRGLDGELLHPAPFTDITDQIGVRVITYVQSDVAAVADLLDDQLVVTDDRDMGLETASEGRFGYASRHLLVGLDAAREGRAEHAALREQRASVQIRTVLQHAWAEFEHEARYKGSVPADLAPDLDRRFTLAAGLLELADQEFSSIRERLRAPSGATSSPVEPEDPRLDPRELAAFLAGQYDDAGWSRTDHYAWISGLLLELGVTSLDELAEVLRRPELEHLNETMGYRFPPGAVRRLDDALLAVYGERYLALRGNAPPASAAGAEVRAAAPRARRGSASRPPRRRVMDERPGLAHPTPGTILISRTTPSPSAASASA